MISKKFEKIVVMRINYLIKEYQFLFKKYIEGWKLLSIKNVIYIILKKVYKT